MQILKKDLKSNNIIVRPESPTDLYILSNIIHIGDQVITKTHRRIRRAGTDGRSGDESKRIAMTIGINVEDFAFHDSFDNTRLRVKGKIYLAEKKVEQARKGRKT